MNEINREQFEAWLFGQPDERTFDYVEGFWNDKTGCVMCNFLREQTNIKNFIVWPSFVSIGFESENPLPVWFIKLMQQKTGRYLTANQVKHHYLTLFPNAIVGNTQPSAIAEKVEHVSIAQVTNGNLANAEFAAQTIK